MKTKLFVLAAGALALSGCTGRFYSGGAAKGDQGDPGLPGSDGSDGLSAYELYLEEHPDYPGDEEEWLDDLAAGLLEVEDFGLDLNQYAKITGGNAALFRVNGDCVELNVKEYYRGDPVTMIVPDAGILAAEKLEKISVSKYVEYIGQDAFFGSDCLREVTLGERVSFIGESAFSCCYELETVNFPNSISHLGKNCFSGAPLRSFVCPASLKVIGEYAFSYCTELQEIVLHDELEEIQAGGFYYTGFSSIFIPASVQIIGSRAFGNYSDSTTIYCEAASKPDGWADDWAMESGSLNVVWGASRP